MGLTHDYSDAPRNRRSATGLSMPQRGTPQLAEGELRVGIPRILRRRARWVSVRLRHPRN
ncbi:hypothetical protein ACFY2H_19290 [Streptomyces griseofuscus]|uniref:Uncharacterized protein n=1 Tax=Streptomyces griseofuscus TaxID=146922 RepID=A0A7H1Q0U2_9ACTN|nr:MULTISPECIES: hypothetical protein [Streptomyces]BBC94586.1 hypothetical protein SRO_3410 [Streptomyces rochei]MYR91808.1 hypothetical protein [Streptomyces sp. SID685]QHC30614.1 hypothetical protein GR129_19260 [Streptomyces sp. HF10]QNT93922.1 hypothetical protein HEP81_03622 [Streptomyces griseofuscus]WKE70482.1 hypothetical protein QHG49_16265 [Streptomyces sp. WP-1]